MKETGRSSWHLIGQAVLSVTLICGLMIIIAVGIVKLGGEPLAGRMEKVSDELGNGEEADHVQRGDIWRATWGLIRAHPVTGIGFGAYNTAIPRYHHSSGSGIPASAINSYLDLGAGGGLIGTLLAAWFLITVMLKVHQRLKSRDRFGRAVALGGLAALFGLAVHSLVDSGLQVPINAVIFCALVVMVIADTDDLRVRHEA